MCLANDPRWRTPFFIMMISILLSSLLQIPARHYPQFHPDLVDGLRGLFIGIAIGTMILRAIHTGRTWGRSA